MFSLLIFIIGAIFFLFRSKRNLLIQNCLHKKEIEILKRQNQKRKLIFKNSDRIVFAVMNKVNDIKEHISIVKLIITIKNKDITKVMSFFYFTRGEDLLHPNNFFFYE
jgi:hypothetical protein